MLDPRFFVLYGLTFSLGRRFTAAMPAKTTQEIGDMTKTVASICETQIKLIIHGVVIVFVEKAAIFNETSQEEQRARGVNIAHVTMQQDEAAERYFPADLSGSPVLVSPYVVSVKHVCPRALLKSFCDTLKATLQVKIVGIKPADDIALRHPETLIERIALAAVRL